MTPVPEAAVAPGNRADRTLLRWLLVWVRPNWRRVIAATALVVAGSALQIVGPLLTAGAIDLYLKPRPEPTALRLQALLVRLGLPSEGGAGLATLTLLYLASLIISAALLSVQARTMLMTGQLVMRDLRQGLFAHLQRLDLAWFNRTPAGRVITRLTNDVEAVRKAMRDVIALGQKGVALSGEGYQGQMQFEFSGLSKLKPEMVEEATKNARAVAEKFAEDSGSRLGRIRSAQQGQFSIENRDSTTPHIKKVRVVSTVEYHLAA